MKNQSTVVHCSNLTSLYDNNKVLAFLNNLLIPVTFEARILDIVPFLTLVTEMNVGIRLSLAEMFLMLTIGDSKVAREKAS